MKATPYVARTAGGETVLELRQGALADIPEADRANWRAVMEAESSLDRLTQVRTYPQLIASGDNPVVMTWLAETGPAEWNKLRLKQYASQVRWDKTQAGLTLSNGIKLSTTDASQGRITAALLILERGWVKAIRWKADSGWIDVDLATMTQIAQAVAAYVQACFATEAAIGDAINAGDISSGTAIDAFGWPAQ